MMRPRIASPRSPAVRSDEHERCDILAPLANRVAQSPAQCGWAPPVRLSPVWPPLLATSLTRPQAINEFDVLGSGEGGCGGLVLPTVGGALGRSWHPRTGRRVS